MIQITQDFEKEKHLEVNGRSGSYCARLLGPPEPLCPVASFPARELPGSGQSKSRLGRAGQSEG